MSLRPTVKQAETLQRMIETGRTLRRWPGGFWTTDEGPFGCERKGLDGCAVPSWSVSVATVRALERAGWVERCNVHPEEWRDERRVTEAGRECAG